jgi:hypothetical protein
MALSPSNLLEWVVVIMVILVLVPIVAMNMMILTVAWIPLVIALAIFAVVLFIRSRRHA